MFYKDLLKIQNIKQNKFVSLKFFEFTKIQEDCNQKL